MVAGIELLELLRESLKGIRKPFLLIDQIAEIREQILVGLPDAGAAAGRVLDHVLELLGQVRDGGGFLLKLLQLAREHLWIEDDVCRRRTGRAPARA